MQYIIMASVSPPYIGPREIIIKESKSYVDAIFYYSVYYYLGGVIFTVITIIPIVYSNL